ncbi:MAG TPA: hypothetical protein VME47_24415 [Acetobacteraceae bacterium]|nr:hypothetical protein [Acetobacteraceae bacterium]
MKQSFSKLGFIHRRLWQRDGLYRLAMLLGPAPLLGCLVAAGVWRAAGPIIHPRPPALPWAKVDRPPLWSNGDGQPHVVMPSRPLPPSGANGGLVGYTPGWDAWIAPIEVSAADVDVTTRRLGRFVINSSAVDMAQIIRQEPADSLFVGTGIGFLAVRAAGVYAISARFDRPAAPRANCLVRLAFGPHRVTSAIEAGVHDDFSRTYEAARFYLQPGLYWIGWAFGCWRGRETTGLGRMTLLIGHPGDTGLEPARADDIVRPDSGTR